MEIQRLLGIMRTLRSENGCPWDREQTLDTLRPYAVEEVYEVIDAIDRGDVADHCEELGDLLLQVVFQAQLREEAGEFNFEDVAKAISDKLVRRHPHVFGEVVVADAREVVRNWNAIKEGEKAGRDPADSRLDKVPKHLPALLKAEELQKTAAKTGFDWPGVAGVLDKLYEELTELRAEVEAGHRDNMHEELGDLLFVVANLGRHLGVSAEQALQDACTKFRQRFREVERSADSSGTPMEDHSLEELDAYWNRAKAAERES